LSKSTRPFQIRLVQYILLLVLLFASMFMLTVTSRLNYYKTLYEYFFNVSLVCGTKVIVVFL
jgi:hypothetical protein